MHEGGDGIQLECIHRVGFRLLRRGESAQMASIGLQN